MLKAKNPKIQKSTHWLLRLAVLFLASAAAAVWPASAREQTAGLDGPQSVAPGVTFYRSTDSSLVASAGRIAMTLLSLDPERVQLSAALSNDEVMGAETVPAIAQRRGAVAAINGGFFNTRNGEPVSLLKVSGELVSDNAAVKGVALIRSPVRGKTTLEFDQASVRQTLEFTAGGRKWSIPIDGVDTTRERGKLMIYSPGYHSDTDTAGNGIEWVLEGQPLAVTAVHRDAGRTPIPRSGAVLSFGGLDPPPSLAVLTPGTRVSITTTWRSLNGVPASHFDRADHIVNGAGLLRRGGRIPQNWERGEGLSVTNFIAMRHPRTVIGVDGKGTIWLAAIDGRQPNHSIGMTFEDMQRLCDRLGLRDALNLDGGGSTTMVVNGAIVNKPSDIGGPRAVSDALLVTAR